MCIYYHEEADTKIVYHIVQINQNYRIRVHCTDSDIPIIMLANFTFRKGDTDIIFEMGTSKKKMYLDINKIHVGLGDLLARSLAVCHIFTGNDYNPSFFRKGKKMPFKILKNNLAFQEAFINLIHSSPSNIETKCDVFKIIEEYVCRMYGLKTKNDVDNGRFEMFERSFKNNNKTEEIFKKYIKSFDASNLPPSKQELLQQIKRTIYISSVWCNAHKKTPTERSPEECGWTLIDGRYAFYWFDGPESPTFNEIIVERRTGNFMKCTHIQILFINYLYKIF